MKVKQQALSKKKEDSWNEEKEREDEDKRCFKFYEPYQAHMILLMCTYMMQISDALYMVYHTAVKQGQYVGHYTWGIKCCPLFFHDN